MCEEQNFNNSPSRKETEHSTPDILISESGERLFQSLFELIQHEKRNLMRPEEEPDELRHIVHCAVFEKVIVPAADYRCLLWNIKAEYDTVIRELKRRESESLITCQKWANQLRDRISDLQRQTSKLQEEIKRWKSANEQSTWIPGLAVAESEDPEALGKHLQHLEAQRVALLVGKSISVSLDIKAELGAKLQTADSLRVQLSTENTRLKVLSKRLRLMCDSLSSWGEGEVPLEEVLGSTLEILRQTYMMDDGTRSINAELFEEEEPSGVDESELLTDYLDRFVKRLDSAQYEGAAVLAARSHGGVLRSLHSAQMFKGEKHKCVHSPLGSPPPPAVVSGAADDSPGWCGAAGTTLPAVHFLCPAV